MDYQFVQTSVWLGNWLRQQRPTLLWRGMHQVNQELIFPFKSPSCLSVYAEITHKNNIKTLDERTVMNWYTQKPENETESFAQSRTQFYKQFTQLQEFCDGRKSCNIPVNPKFFKGTIRLCDDRGTYRVRERFIKKCCKPTGGNASLGNTFLEIYYWTKSIILIL